MEHVPKSPDQDKVEKLARKKRVGNTNTEMSIGTMLMQPERSSKEASPRNGHPENIGHFLVAAESGARQRSAEKSAARKQAEGIGRGDLLTLSASIMVDGTNLRQVYESHLISEKGLRRIVAEHLAGGDVAAALRRELVEREIDFERDPELRDRARSSVTGADSGKEALQSLLASAGALPQDSTPKPKSRQTVKPASSLAIKRKHQQMIDVALTVTIAVLVIVIIFLLVRS